MYIECQRKAFYVPALRAEAGLQFFSIVESVPRSSAVHSWRRPRSSLTVFFPHCSRHPVRHISFNSHSLITANVPYEKVVRNSDLDNFACHRRSVEGLDTS